MNIVIVDYGLGNLMSVRRAIESTNHSVKISSDPSEIASASHLVLPGVGAFADGMKGLEEKKLVDPIKQFCASKKPFLGICLGMQMLFEEAEEFGLHCGLGIIPGRVVKIPDTDSLGNPHKIPHIGWNSIHRPQGSTQDYWKDTPLSKTNEKSSVYFVHSYTAQPKNPAHRLADCLYNGRLILAATKMNSVYGCQFHPEKSAHVGVEILKTFCEL